MARDSKLGGDAKRLVLATPQQNVFRRTQPPMRQRQITADGKLTAPGKENTRNKTNPSKLWGVRGSARRPVMVALTPLATKHSPRTRSPASKARALTGLRAPRDETPVLAGEIASPRRIQVGDKLMSRTGKVQTGPDSRYYTFADETAPYIPPKPVGQALKWSHSFFQRQKNSKALTTVETFTTSTIVSKESFPKNQTKRARPKTQDQIMKGTAQHYMESRGFIYQDAAGARIKTHWFWGHLLAETLLQNNDPRRIDPKNLMAVTQSANAYEAAITAGLKDAIQAENATKGHWTLTITVTRTKVMNEITGETLYSRSASDKQVYSYVYTDEHGTSRTPINFHIEPLNPNPLSYAGIRAASKNHFSVTMKGKCLFSPDSQRCIPASFFHHPKKDAAQTEETDKAMPLKAQYP